MADKPKAGFYGFTGCAGCLLTILNCEDELLDIFNAADVKSFLMANRENFEDEPLDVAFVEGSITTEEQLEKLKKIREKSKIVVAIGTCSCYGGVQSMYFGDGNFEKRWKQVYGDAKIELTEAFESKPIDEFIKVDFYLPGCPIDKRQFLEFYSQLVRGIPPRLPHYPVCAECKWNENECLLMKGKLCLGPITRGGCNARCPSDNVPCVGCFGPADEVNINSEMKLLLERNYSREEIIRRIRTFAGASFVRQFSKLLGEEAKK